MPTSVYLLLGSNLGDRQNFLKQASSRISQIPNSEIIATSAIYNTEPQDMEGENPPFLNQVILIEYDNGPEKLLEELEKIESGLGRTNKGDYLPRTIDIDILLFGEQIIKTEKLTIPHPRLVSRPFALIPLVQLAPELTDPLSGNCYKDYIEVDDHLKVIPIEDHVARNF